MKRLAALLAAICVCASAALAGSWHVPVQQYFIGSGSPSFAFGDFNGDDLTDLFILRKADSCVASLLFGRGDGTFDPPAALAFQGYRQPACGANQFLVFDANSDGLDDVAFRAGSVAWIVLNSGSLVWNSSIAMDHFWCLYSPSPPTGNFGLLNLIAPSDCDGDGDTDLLAFGYREESEYYYRPYIVPYINASDAVWTCANAIRPTYEYATDLHGDFNNDGFTDIIMKGGCTVTFCVLYGQACSFAQSECKGGMFNYNHVIADFNGDGYDDIFWNSDYPSGNVAYGGAAGFTSGDTYSYWPYPGYCSGAHGNGTFGGDVTGDGLDDLAIIDCSNIATTHELAAVFQISAGDTFIMCDTLFFPAHEKWGMAAADLNGDAKDDICYFISSDTLGVFVNEPPVATLLACFEARVEASRDVTVAWETAPGADCSSFAVWRSFDRGSFELLRRLDAASYERSYRLVDAGPRAHPGAVATYRLEAVWRDGSTRVLALEDVRIPEARFVLRQNVPNPFNPATAIIFELPARETVWLEVFDVSGKLVRRLIAGETRGPGAFAERWEGTSDAGGRVASGIYYCRLRAGKRAESIKMVMVQ